MERVFTGRGHRAFAGAHEDLLEEQREGFSLKILKEGFGAHLWPSRGVTNVSEFRVDVLSAVYLTCKNAFGVFVFFELSLVPCDFARSFTEALSPVLWRPFLMTCKVTLLGTVKGHSPEFRDRRLVSPMLHTLALCPNNFVDFVIIEESLIADWWIMVPSKLAVFLCSDVTRPPSKRVFLGAEQPLSNSMYAISDWPSASNVTSSSPSITTSSYEPHLSSVSNDKYSTVAVCARWFSGLWLVRPLKVVEDGMKWWVLTLLCCKGQLPSGEVAVSTFAVVQLSPSGFSVPFSSVFGDTKLWHSFVFVETHFLIRQDVWGWLDDDGVAVVRILSSVSVLRFSLFLSAAGWPDVGLAIDDVYNEETKKKQHEEIRNYKSFLFLTEIVLEKEIRSFTSLCICWRFTTVISNIENFLSCLLTFFYLTLKRFNDLCVEECMYVCMGQCIFGLNEWGIRA